MNISEVMKGAPRYITLRYGALNSYVWESLFPEDYRNRIFSDVRDPVARDFKFQRMKSLADEASLLVFIYVTKKVFEEGARAAKNAVDIFKELDIDEFYLGRSKFSGRNENVVLGDNLANELFALLSQDAKKLISEAHFISNIIDKYKEVRKDI